MEGFAKVGMTRDLAPGTMKVVRTPGGKRLLVNAAGSFYAIDPDCTHQGCDLVDGALSGTSVTCPCHFARFDVVTGQIVGGPATEPVQTYEVKVVGDEVWVAT
jgi:3-phenylpropionate/trans-cinnamate dioxygenase ferredoxin subunit